MRVTILSSLVYVLAAGFAINAPAAADPAKIMNNAIPLSSELSGKSQKAWLEIYDKIPENIDAIVLNRKFGYYYSNYKYSDGTNTSQEASFNQYYAYSNVYQRGAVTATQDNVLYATQSGEYNNVTINQLGDNNYASLYQSNTSNQADLLQSSDNLYANVQQYGAGNNATLRQYSTSSATLYQNGTDNTATILQGNASGATQLLSSTVNIQSIGGGNSVYAVQAGYYGGNSLSVYQRGTNNSSMTTQTGYSSAIKLSQTGDNNSFSAKQTAHGKVLTVAMDGNGGNISLNHN